MENVSPETYRAFFAGMRAAGVKFQVRSHDSVEGTGSNDSTYLDGRLIAQRTVTYRAGGNLCSWRIAR